MKHLKTALFRIVIFHAIFAGMISVAIAKEWQHEQRDIETVAITLWSEARGEGNTGIMAVASVIYNRANERNKFPSEICLQAKQFSCWNTGKPSMVLKNSQDRAIWAFCKQVATDLYTGNFEATTRANHYYNAKLCNPSWAKKLKHIEVIGNHTFGRL